jgi:hypothetical protein
MFEGKKHLFLIIVLCVLSLFTLMIGNDGVSLTHPDEVFYNQTAKEMIAHRSWLTPYLFGQPQFEKPILTYWLLIVAIKIFGLTAFAARFMPSLFGILGVLDVSQEDGRLFVSCCFINKFYMGGIVTVCSYGYDLFCFGDLIDRFFLLCLYKYQTQDSRTYSVFCYLRVSRSCQRSPWIYFSSRDHDLLFDLSS